MFAYVNSPLRSQRVLGRFGATLGVHSSKNPCLHPPRSSISTECSQLGLLVPIPAVAYGETISIEGSSLPLPFRRERLITPPPRWVPQVEVEVHKYFVPKIGGGFHQHLGVKNHVRGTLEIESRDSVPIRRSRVCEQGGRCTGRSEVLVAIRHMGPYQLRWVPLDPPSLKR